MPLLAAAIITATIPNEIMAKPSMEAKLSMPNFLVNPQNPIHPNGSEKIAMACVMTIVFVMLIR